MAPTSRTTVEDHLHIEDKVEAVVTRPSENVTITPEPIPLTLSVPAPTVTVGPAQPTLEQRAEAMRQARTVEELAARVVEYVEAAERRR